MQLVLALDGYCLGPLFAPARKTRAPRCQPGSTTQPGRLRRGAEVRATPGWIDRNAVRTLFREAEKLTCEQGVLWSVAHLVPLRSTLVCGLHWHVNMKIELLADNMRASNKTWPDMWEQQAELEFE